MATRKEKKENYDYFDEQSDPFDAESSDETSPSMVASAVDDTARQQPAPNALQSERIQNPSSDTQDIVQGQEEAEISATDMRQCKKRRAPSSAELTRPSRLRARKYSSGRAPPSNPQSFPRDHAERAGDRRIAHPRLRDEYEDTLKWKPEQVDSAPDPVLLVKNQVTLKPDRLKVYVGTADMYAESRDHTHADKIDRRGREVFIEVHLAQKPGRKRRTRYINNRGNNVVDSAFEQVEAERHDARTKVEKLLGSSQPGDPAWDQALRQHAAEETMSSEAHIHFQNQYRPWGNLIAPQRLDTEQLLRDKDKHQFRDLEKVFERMNRRDPGHTARTFSCSNVYRDRASASEQEFASRLYRKFQVAHGDRFGTVHEFWDVVQEVCAMSNFPSCTWVNLKTWRDARRDGQSWLPPAWLDAVIWLRSFFRDDTYVQFVRRYRKLRQRGEITIPRPKDAVVRLDCILTLYGELLFIHFHKGFAPSILDSSIQASTGLQSQTADPSLTDNVLLVPAAAGSFVFFGPMQESMPEALLALVNSLPARLRKAPFPAREFPATFEGYTAPHDAVDRDVVRGLRSMLAPYEKYKIDEFPWRVPYGAEGESHETMVIESIRHCPAVITALVARLSPPKDRTLPKQTSSLDLQQFANGERCLHDPSGERAISRPTHEQAIHILERLSRREREEVTRRQEAYYSMEHLKYSQMDQVDFLMYQPQEAEMFRVLGELGLDRPIQWATSAGVAIDSTRPPETLPATVEAIEPRFPVTSLHQFSLKIPPTREQVQFVVDIINRHFSGATNIQGVLESALPDFGTQFLMKLGGYLEVPVEFSKELAHFVLAVDFIFKNPLDGASWALDSAKPSIQQGWQPPRDPFQDLTHQYLNSPERIVSMTDEELPSLEKDEAAASPQHQEAEHPDPASSDAASMDQVEEEVSKSSNSPMGVRQFFQRQLGVALPLVPQGVRDQYEWIDDLPEDRFAPRRLLAAGFDCNAENDTEPQQVREDSGFMLPHETNSGHCDFAALVCE